MNFKNKNHNFMNWNGFNLTIPQHKGLVFENTSRYDTEIKGVSDNNGY